MGAGVCGLAAAIEIARNDRSVSLLETHRVGFGASSRSMGLLSGVAREAEELLLQLLDESAAECEMQHGAVLLAPSERNLRDLTYNIPRRKEEYGTNDYAISRRQLSEEVGGRAAQEFAGALVMPDARYLHPGKMVHALAIYAQSLGVTICENTEVTGWRRDQDKVAVDCGERRIRCGELLLTTGGYGGDLSSALWRRTLSIPSTAAVSAELPRETVAEVFPSARMLMVNRFRGFNCRPSFDGKRILLAGPVAAEPRTVAANLHDVRQHFERLFPSLAGIEFAHCWIGLVGAARDRCTHIGIHDGAWYALGANGIANSTYAGHLASRHVLGFDATATADHGFSAWPLRANEKLLWAGIRTSARLLDVLGRSRLR